MQRVNSSSLACFSGGAVLISFAPNLCYNFATADLHNTYLSPAGSSHMRLYISLSAFLLTAHVSSHCANCAIAALALAAVAA